MLQGLQESHGLGMCLLIAPMLALICLHLLGMHLRNILHQVLEFCHETHVAGSVLTLAKVCYAEVPLTRVCHTTGGMGGPVFQALPEPAPLPPLPRPAPMLQMEQPAEADTFAAMTPMNAPMEAPFPQAQPGAVYQVRDFFMIMTGRMFVNARAHTACIGTTHG